MPVGAQQVSDNTTINIRAPEFFESLGPLLANTHTKTLRNYVFWRIAVDSSNFLTEGVRLRKIKFEQSFKGGMDYGERWTECVKATIAR